MNEKAAPEGAALVVGPGERGLNREQEARLGSSFSGERTMNGAEHLFFETGCTAIRFRLHAGPTTGMSA
jgi:hypothetical protein